MLRKRKNRRYNETNDDEGDGERKFDLAEQIKSQRFDSQIRDKHLVELSGNELNLRLIQKNGFERPMLVAKPDGLDLHVPPKSFLVRDVRNAVGHQRIIDVMDVKTQKNIEMSMKDWCKYYESKNRDRLLNVISLEFSHTELDQLVESPSIVRLLDWVDLVWPKFLKESQTESTNSIDKMKYPKVQKYCLMSVRGSYTDFHLDFGGTSVWYHILKGRKIFWMVPPTELNLQIFEEWTLSGMQQDVFFGDTVEECFRVELCAGNTFFIPSGWIHAVYTLEDSLVFGGNFLHSFGIENQLKVSKIEDATKVPIKFRYPFYTEILWYAVQHYVYCLTEKDHLHRPEPEKLPPPVAEKTKSIEIEDETTESEQDECDTRKKTSSTSKRRRGRSSKSTPKKVCKPPTDDESTDIDSANEEELTKPAAPKPTINTCRMTKNSLLRLQYEIDEKEALNKSIKPDNSNKSPTKRKSESSATNPTTPAPLNLADIVLSHESKLNGWSGIGSGQSIWSKPNNDSDEPKKVHITKYELNGLKLLVKHLSKLSGAKKNLPNLIRNSRALLDDCRRLIVEHENDDPELAITGKPIIPKMLHTKQADMNELIGQFFKPSENNSNAANNEASGNLMPLSSSSGNFNNKSKQHNEASKFYHSPDRDVEKKTNASGAGESAPSKTPQKETKCLTPNKKSANIAPNHASTSSTLSSTSNATNSGSSTISPPPRPKSPPTRPLSNNQYSSKPKSNNNLLLPGSFADLIAATSTEKKVFDITGADVASSLFGGGVRDHGSSKSNSLHSSKTSKDNIRHNSSNSSNQSTNLSKSSATKTTDHEGLPAATTSSGASVTSVIKEPPKPNSPEPPKASPQKRFIHPTSFRPQNKEKLIYASAPYVNPVHAATEQSRSSNLYSTWQTAATQNAPNYSPATPKPAHSSAGPFGGVLVSPTGSTYTPDQRTMNPAPNQSKQHTSLHQQQAVSESSDIKNERQDHQASSNNEQQRANVIVMSTSDKSMVKPTLEQPQPAPKADNAATDELKTSASKSSEEAEQKAKKPIKPRGPPKKSKEARQVIESTLDVQPVVPVSVIKTATITTKPAVVIDAQPQPPKVKAKRAKKQKPETIQAAPTVPPVTTAAPIQPSVICGLMPPVTSAAGQKGPPQPYFISRPFMFNSMSAFSAAQYQQMPRAQMPLLTTTALGAPLGLPLQQGARIVWATQPRPPNPAAVSNVPIPSTQTATATTAKAPLLVPGAPVTSHSDNAALLSLATTALSTAPMITSPAISQMSNRSQSPQALMVSSAPTQAAGLFTAQQFFRPIVQQMPTHFITRPGAPRQSGQLVFARLPNQNQPRYLITQPGFMPQRFQTPHAVTSQPSSSLAFATFKPHTEAPKVMKAKKVKTN